MARDGAGSGADPDADSGVDPGANSGPGSGRDAGAGSPGCSMGDLLQLVAMYLNLLELRGR